MIHVVMDLEAWQLHEKKRSHPAMRRAVRAVTVGTSGDDPLVQIMERLEKIDSVLQDLVVAIL
jgi:hypothetical protein